MFAFCPGASGANALDRGGAAERIWGGSRDSERETNESEKANDAWHGYSLAGEVEKGGLSGGTNGGVARGLALRKKQTWFM